MWNSRIYTKKRIMAAVIFVLLAFGVFFIAYQTGESIIIGYFVGACVFVWLVINLGKWYRTFSQRNNFQHFVEHVGWIYDSVTDAVVLMPPHLLPDRWSQLNLHGKSMVYKKMIAGHTAWMVFEEWWKVEQDPQKAPIQRLQPTESLGSHVSYVMHLPGIINGWARLVPAPDRFFSYPDDLDLESNQFNKNVYYHAEPASLAPAVMSPNLMGWYLDLPDKPWIHVEKNQAVFSFQRKFVYEDIEMLQTTAQMFLELLTHSGALEPATKAE